MVGDGLLEREAAGGGAGPAPGGSCASVAPAQKDALRWRLLK